MSFLSALHDRVTKVSSVLSAICVALTVLFYCYEIVTRYFLNAPTKWASSITLYLLLVSVMLMTPYITRTRGHVSVAYIVELVGPATRRIIYRCISLIGCLVCLGSAYFAVHEAHRAFVRGVNTTDALGIPTWWLLSFVIYGLTSAGLYFGRQIFEPVPEQPEMH